MPPFLDKHYEARTVEEVNAVYDAWAETYESELAGENYQGALSVATVVDEAIADRDASILDVGCGTGLVGQHLRSAGFTRVSGLDLSEGMLSQARAKGCYQELHQMNLLHPLSIPRESFDAVASAGLFTLSLLGPDVLERVCELTRRGGTAIIGINVQAFTEQDYTSTLDKMVRERDGEIAMIRDMPYWPDKGITSRVVVLRL